MTTPIILLTGEAGSGKDTIANFIKQDFNAQPIAHADPMKRLAARVFGFDTNTLWGPSAARNAPQGDYGSEYAWLRAELRLDTAETEAWVEDVFKGSKHTTPNLMRGLRGWLAFNKAKTFDLGVAFTARFALQTLGTEFGREMGINTWSDYTIRSAFDLLNGGYSYDPTVGLISDKSKLGYSYAIITDGRFRNEVVNAARVGAHRIKVTSPVQDNSAVEKAGVAGHVSEKEQKTIPDHFFTGFFDNDKAYGLRAAQEASLDLMWSLENNRPVFKIATRFYP